MNLNKLTKRSIDSMSLHADNLFSTIELYGQSLQVYQNLSKQNQFLQRLGITGSLRNVNVSFDDLSNMMLYTSWTLASIPFAPRYTARVQRIKNTLLSCGRLTIHILKSLLDMDVPIHIYNKVRRDMVLIWTVYSNTFQKAKSVFEDVNSLSNQRNLVSRSSRSYIQ